jgi:PAS domain S-box-containing protein
MNPEDTLAHDPVGPRALAAATGTTVLTPQAEDAIGGTATAELELLFEQAPGFMSLMRGPRHVIAMANAAYRHLVGERPLQGLEFRLALPDLEGQGYFELLDKVYATGQPFVGQSWPLELSLPGANQRVQRFVDFVYQPVVGPGRVVRGIFLQGQDVTEQHIAFRELQAAESRLRESETHFRLVAETIPQFIWGGTAEGLTDYYNSQFLDFLGRSLDELRGWKWVESVHPSDRRRVLHSWARTVKQGCKFVEEFRLRRADGMYRWVRAEGFPVREAQGPISRWFGICADVHDLREEARRKDEFLATLAHELRNPLAPITNAARMLASGSASPEVIQKSSQIIERQTRQMAHLLDDLLDIARITAGRLELKREYVELQALVNTALEMARPSVDARQHRIVVAIDTGPVVLELDPVRIAQVLTNLLNNAAKYTDPGGTITLSAQVFANTVEFSVRDTGIGIRSEALLSVFEMFAQETAALERSAGGLGIGLALARGIVELHGGSVEAHSEGEGRGSEFRVRIPGAVSPVWDKAGASHLKGFDANPNARSILVVDDNVDAAESLALYFQMRGHQATVAHSGESALEQAERQRPEVIILDIGMAGMNGYEVARLLRNRAWGRAARLIALTGWGQEEDRRKAFASGFDEHLTKPVNPDAILKML